MTTKHSMYTHVKLWRIPALDEPEFIRAQLCEQAFAPHDHDEYMIGVVEQGFGKFVHCGSTYTVTAGLLLLVNPHDMHAGYAPPGTSWVYRTIYPSQALIQRIATHHGGADVRSRFPVPVVYAPILARRLLRLHVEAEAACPGVEHGLCALLSDLLHEHAGSALVDPSSVNDVHAVARTRAYLDAHAAEKITLAELTQVVGMSSYHLLRIFRAHVGLSPHTYQLQLRLKQAKHLLRAGMTSAQVAAETGFFDQSHFTEYFKHAIGVTPAQYALACL